MLWALVMAAWFSVGSRWLWCAEGPTYRPPLNSFTKWTSTQDSKTNEKEKSANIILFEQVLNFGFYRYSYASFELRHSHHTDRLDPHASANEMLCVVTHKIYFYVLSQMFVSHTQPAPARETKPKKNENINALCLRARWLISIVAATAAAKVSRYIKRTNEKEKMKLNAELF